MGLSLLSVVWKPYRQQIPPLCCSGVFQDNHVASQRIPVPASVSVQNGGPGGGGGCGGEVFMN